jgi:hypothetical protein
MCGKSILSGEEIQSETKIEKKETPYDLMMKVIDSERYSAVTI